MILFQSSTSANKTGKTIKNICIVLLKIITILFPSALSISTLEMNHDMLQRKLKKKLSFCFCQRRLFLNLQRFPLYFLSVRYSNREKRNDIDQKKKKYPRLLFSKNQYFWHNLQGIMMTLAGMTLFRFSCILLWPSA